MNHPIDDLLPFYINGTLDAADMKAVEEHLSICPECQAQLAGWEQISRAVYSAEPDRLPVPPLSPVVKANLQPQPPLMQAAFSTVQLVWIQRIFAAHSWIELSLGGLLLMTGLASFIYEGLDYHWSLFLLFAAAPFAPLLATAFQRIFDEDPAWEITGTVPTSTDTLFFSRQTFSLGLIGLVALFSSLLLVIFGKTPLSLFQVIAVWLGPMLLLSAMTTLLSLCLPPQAAPFAVLFSWAGILILLIYEQIGRPLIGLPLNWLLTPSLPLLAVQVFLAGLLWLVSWYWFTTGSPSWLHSNGDR